MEFKTSAHLSPPSAPASRAVSSTRFRSLVLLALLITQGGTLVGMLWMGRMNSERIVQVQTRTNLQQLTQLTVANLSALAATGSNTIRLLKIHLESPDMLHLTDQQLLRAMRNTLDATDQIQGAMLGREDGRFMFVQREGQRGQERFTRLISGRPLSMLDVRYDVLGRELSRNRAAPSFDPRGRPWFKAAQANPGQVQWTDPYVFIHSQHPGITVAVQLNNPLQPPTVLALTLELSALAHALAAIPTTPGGRAFIADQHGQAIAASHGWPEELHGRIPRLSEVQDAPLQALLAVQGPLPLQQPQRHFTFQMNGETYVAYLQRLELQPGLNWVIGVYAPVRDFTGALKSYYLKELWLIVAVLGVSSLLAWPLLIGATRPLAQLEQQATTDALTGLQNRASFLDRLLAELREPPVKHVELGVAIVDLDGFKAVNDTFGHGMGDQVLQVMSSRLLEQVRSTDALGRLGGDEFALILKGRSREQIKLRLEGILARISEQLVQTAQHQHLLGATAGLAFRNSDHDGAQQLLEAADQALMRGKRLKKGVVWLAAQEIISA